MAFYKNCVAVLLGLSLLTESSVSAAKKPAAKKAVAEVGIKYSCGFNDHELEPDSRSPHESNPNYMWPNGEIPYVFTRSVESRDKNLIENNMKQIEQHSCFRFKKLYVPPRDKKYLEIHIPSGAGSCFSGGYYRFSANVNNRYLVTGQKNALQLFSDNKLADKEECREPRNKDMYEGGILHEMFHALGVGHTMRRSDRDDYITVYGGNIADFAQYDKCGNCKVYSDIPYECSSIMHYGYGTIAKNCRQPQCSYPTMQAKYPSTCKIGFNGNKVATDNDWKLIKRIGNTVCGTGGYGGGGSVGQWGAWENIGYCSGTCEEASQRQRRSCVGGTGCPGSSTRSVECEKSGCKCTKGWFCCNYPQWC